MVWYAFGTAGDIDIANVEPTEEKILEFNDEAKQNKNSDSKSNSTCFWGSVFSSAPLITHVYILYTAINIVRNDFCTKFITDENFCENNSA